ncbi:hypothetical protein [Streptomyces sp. SAJ15]|uniref:hypothetical protein n=1 Tax=Streptomyces sp. SAJ15 TaxID=2011095 RepID=UPI0011862149|nr:hypothetical protein [Streptomyces sp. SAJ15]TVL89728.1 hypothetical protein CD790_25345 [Streptomyces sp. SAJ15]
MPCRAARRLKQHLGRRGAFLLILGTGKTCWGVGFIAVPATNPQGLQLLTDVMPLNCWAWLWILCGLITVASAFLQIGRDWIGFVSALIPPTVWATAYAAAVVTGDFPRGGFVAAWYLTSHVGVILWAATVPEYSVPPVPRRARRGKGA